MFLFISNKSNVEVVIAADADNEDDGLGLGESVSSLNAGLLKVKAGNIGEWNLHKHVKGDRELKPIMIPF